MQVQTNAKTRVLVVDDQKTVREILCSNLESEPDLEIVGTAADGEEAIAAISRLQPDVVLLDIVMQETDGLTATRIIAERFPETKILALSSHDSSEYLDRAIEMGAHGYATKDTDVHELVEAIRALQRDPAQLPVKKLATGGMAEIADSFPVASNIDRPERGVTYPERLRLKKLEDDYLNLRKDWYDLRSRNNALALRLAKLDKRATRNRGALYVLATILAIFGFAVFFYSPENLSPFLSPYFPPYPAPYNNLPVR